MADKIGRFEVVRLLGRGGMAEVYLADDSDADRQVAIKLLPQHLLHDPQFKARFEREARVLAKLSHPNIVPMYEFGYHGEQPYMVNPHMAGGSLEDLLKTKGKLSVAQAVAILEPMCAALEAAHKKGIIHRDLKPGNILFDEEGRVYVADFGIAKLVEGSTGLTGTAVVGTPAYMSPEQFEAKKELDGRSDQYSLAIMLFEMLSGQTPFKADTWPSMMHMHLVEPPPSIRKLRKDVPQGLATAIQLALSKNPEQRYRSMEIFNSVLENSVSSKEKNKELKDDPADETILLKEKEKPIPTKLSPWAYATGLILILALLVWGLTRGQQPATAAQPDNSTSQQTLQPTQTPTPLPGALTIPLDSLSPEIPWLPLDESKRPTVVFIGINNALAPMNNANVRKAFAAATDRVAIATLASELCFDNVQPATSLTPSETIGRDLYDEVGISYNPEAARQYLAAAGYSDPINFPAVVLMGSVRCEEVNFYEQAANKLVEMWAENLGIRVEVKIIADFDSYLLDYLASNTPHMYLLGWGADENDPNDFLGTLFRSDSETNNSHFNDPEFDGLINRASELSSPELRQSLYLQAEQLLTQDLAGVIPLFHSYFYEGCRDGMRYVNDVTIPDGQQISADTIFTKVWTVENSGTCDWTSGYHLVFSQGNHMGGPSQVLLPPLAVGERTTISVDLVAPSNPGEYTGYWRLANTDQGLFGSQLYVKIVVP